jgi:putative sigma-54 modulation protein
MNIRITGQHLEVTDALRERVEKKCSHLTKHYSQITSTHVHLVKDVDAKVELTLHVRGKDLHAQAHHEDMYAAIDLCTDKMDRQLLKHKEMMKAHEPIAADGMLTRRV